MVNNISRGTKKGMIKKYTKIPTCPTCRNKKLYTYLQQNAGHCAGCIKKLIGVTMKQLILKYHEAGGIDVSTIYYTGDIPEDFDFYQFHPYDVSK